MSNAPHLPPKACRVDTYYRLQNIKWILLFAFFAFIAGASAALVINAWLIPHIWVNELQPSNLASRNQSLNQPDPVFKKQIEQRILAIHDKRLMPGGKFYSADSFVANAAIISSDGWAAAYVPNFSFGQEKNWELADYQSVNYRIEKIVYEKIDHLLFIKVSGQGFRVVSFPRWSDLSAGSNLWAVDFEKWQLVSLSGLERTDSRQFFYIWQPQYSWQLWETPSAKSLLFTANGDWVGTAFNDGKISHGWLIEEQINPLLSSGKLSYASLPWQGYFVKGGPKTASHSKGFYLEKVLGSGSSQLVSGDVIVKINGEAMSQERLAEQLWTAPSEFSLIYLRSGSEKEITVKKSAIFP